MPKPHAIESRDRYILFANVTTRWNDNDVYGHVNNVVYNEWMDTAVTQFFRQHWPGLPDTPTIPVAVDTRFTFHRPIVHPAEVETGFRVERIGSSSVRCGVGVFVAGETTAAAWGHMIHAWVDRESGKSVSIPDQVRLGLESACMNDTGSKESP